MTSRLLRNLVLALTAVAAVGVSTSALADRGRHEERYEWRDRDDDHRWEHKRHWKHDRWERRGPPHIHRHVVRERVVVIEEPRRVYLPPPPVVYREVVPARPFISISVPDIIIPF